MATEKTAGLFLVLIWWCLSGLSLAVGTIDGSESPTHVLSLREAAPKPAKPLMVGPVTCVSPQPQVDMWWYNSWGQCSLRAGIVLSHNNCAERGPLVCTQRNDEEGMWAMLNAYRSGGKEDRYWKYTSDPNDAECLTDWTYYGKDGEWVVEQVKGKLTKRGDKKDKSWCALPVYRSGGQAVGALHLQPPGLEWLG